MAEPCVMVVDRWAASGSAVALEDGLDVGVVIRATPRAWSHDPMVAAPPVVVRPTRKCHPATRT